MFFKPIKMAVCAAYEQNCIVSDSAPVFSWGAETEKEKAFQTAYCIELENDGEKVWSSGWVEDKKQQCTYAGPKLKSGKYYKWSLQIRDNYGLISSKKEHIFLTAKLDRWTAPWITSEVDNIGEAKYFCRKFNIDGAVKSAMMYVCGIGLHCASINGKEIDDAVLQPAYSNYSKQCYYTTYDIKSFLTEGKNAAGVIVGEGWRRNYGRYLDVLKREIEFFGQPMLTAEIVIEYENGKIERIMTDDSWLCGKGEIIFNHLFDGETFDENRINPQWNTPSFDGTDFSNAIFAENARAEMKAQVIQPIKEQKEYAPVIKYRLKNGNYVFDFGVNISGYVRIRIPGEMKCGDKVTMRFAENIFPDGSLDLGTVRYAKVTDCVIKGESKEDFLWKPKFTYHGFRYMEIEGYPCIPSENDVTAIHIYSDVDNESFFRCGSGIVNAIQETIVRTERNNIHSVATDCPQRDERMGWLNDATVRFEEIPYNFNMGRMFPKIIEDVIAEQGDDGSITCTAPRVYGERPADPVCSSFLVAGLSSLHFYGNTEKLQKFYKNFKAWNECLKNNSTNGIVNYSYYGDWAGPADYCDKPKNGAKSIITPGILMSTGYHYYNYKLLEYFANILGDKAEAEENHAEAERVKEAFLKKWWHSSTGLVDRGSQGSQAFALWLDIIPEKYKKLAAKKLHEAVENVGFRLTTGNLTTRYVMDMLAKYGYIDDAWKIITREKYPSWGYMLQNGATTVWERFELKRNSTMNSHDHPMYGAVGSWFYSYIVGINPITAGFQKFRIEPHIPSDLLYAEAKVDTPYGCIYVKWQKQFDEIDLIADIPFGCEAEIKLGENVYTAGSGFFSFSQEMEE